VFDGYDATAPELVPEEQQCGMTNYFWRYASGNVIFVQFTASHGTVSKMNKIGLTNFMGVFFVCVQDLRVSVCLRVARF
jgi:hypothetical protein